MSSVNTSHNKRQLIFVIESLGNMFTLSLIREGHKLEKNEKFSYSQIIYVMRSWLLWLKMTEYLFNLNSGKKMKIVKGGIYLCSDERAFISGKGLTKD